MNVEEKNELDKYLDIPSTYKRRKIMREEIDFYIDYSEHFSTGDSLSSVWLHLKPIFPKTFELARKYLCCQSTSFESKRIFSEIGRISSFIKCNISSEHIEDKILISRNRDLLL